ncbi:hypothetical protein FIBSPDRAFT_394594 [Athelia psychrophila]|uniref:Uncharacterized protein n=1 Tax=Athelia psychrophila TaxID=1759441 RepID=A0A166NMD2_9AGAM|nr:hypothetical protein FIBSPDRAFT_394594 [Fibularhizoctonia sp. CBS 109695]
MLQKRQPSFPLTGGALRQRDLAIPAGEHPIMDHRVSNQCQIISQKLTLNFSCRTNGRHTQEAKAPPFSRVQQEPGEFIITSVAHQQKMCKAAVTDLHVTSRDETRQGTRNAHRHECLDQRILVYSDRVLCSARASASRKALYCLGQT